MPFVEGRSEPYEPVQSAFAEKSNIDQLEIRVATLGDMELILDLMWRAKCDHVDELWTLYWIGFGITKVEKSN